MADCAARPFRRLLVANRGEIACRVIRTAKRMGISTVAVYSDADSAALHVAVADQAVRIGPPAARESYLRIDAIIDAARTSRADAVHPGYGFLAENADFADACAAAGLVFVGPSPATMRAMGDKAAAKTLMQKAGVPLVPGYHGAAQDVAALAKAAKTIGFPVLIKAAAGGGGKGMRVVHAPAEFEEALGGAKREASAAFNDDRVLIEKYLARPRHIEVQVFGDTQGNIVSLHERECTLQRRHQKVIEEAPSPSLNDHRRAAIAQAAREAARAVSYVGAGTVEFIADETGFHFIEMNTRLQVEHAVTEAITGLDLVEWQLRVAAGEPLPLRQDEIALRGHAVEARIYAEDPDRGFLPTTGVLQHWHPPDDLRVDSGFRQGDAVTPHYDPMLAKLIAVGPDRAEAFDALADGLRRFAVAGVTTNIAFLERLVAHPDVRRGVMDTGLIERELAALTAPLPLRAEDLAAAAGAVLVQERKPPQDGWRDPWDDIGGWTMTGERERRFSFRYAGERHDFAVRPSTLTERPIAALWSARDLELVTARGRFKLTWIDPYLAEAGAAGADNRIVAPMPGTVTRIVAEAGATLSRGAPVLVVEAMKMEHTLRAPSDGHLRALNCKVGDVVQEGADLADFEPTKE